MTLGAHEVRFAPACAEIVPPDPNTLAVLRERIDPLGLRRLEFVAARDRAALLDEIVANDRELVTHNLARRRQADRTKKQGGQNEAAP